MKNGSKAWWGKAHRLLEQKAQASSIPALRVGNEWFMKAEEKASAFVDCFAAKNKMIAMEENEYSCIQDLQDQEGEAEVPGIPAVQKALEKLDVDSATGPDLLPTRILKYCAAVLAAPVHQLILAILRDGRWMHH